MADDRKRAQMSALLIRSDCSHAQLDEEIREIVNEVRSKGGEYGLVEVASYNSVCQLFNISRLKLYYLDRERVSCMQVKFCKQKELPIEQQIYLSMPHFIPVS